MPPQFFKKKAAGLTAMGAIEALVHPGEKTPPPTKKKRPKPAVKKTAAQLAQDEAKQAAKRRHDVFVLLRAKMAEKARMTGHTMDDTRKHFEKCTPKELRRPGAPPVRLDAQVFQRSLRALDLGLEQEQVDLIAKSLDVGNTGKVDPTAFIQEAHNFRHHRRAEQLHSTLVSRPAKPLAPPTWLSPRGRPFDPRSVAANRRKALLTGVSPAASPRATLAASNVGLLAGVAPGSARRADEWDDEYEGGGLAPEPSVSDVVSQTSRVPFPSEVGPLYSDYLLKGEGRLSSPSSDMKYAEALLSPRYTNAALVPPKQEKVEEPYYLQLLDQSQSRAYRPVQREKWLDPAGWKNSLPTRSVPAYQHGGVHAMAENPPRHRGTTLTNLGYSASPRVFGGLQRGVLSPMAPIPPPLGGTPPLPEEKIKSLESMPSMEDCMEEIVRARSLRASDRGAKERKANLAA